MGGWRRKRRVGVLIARRNWCLLLDPHPTRFAGRPPPFQAEVSLRARRFVIGDSQAIYGGGAFAQAAMSGLFAALRTRHDADRSVGKVAAFLVLPQ